MTDDRPRGYRRVPIVTDTRGTRNLCCPVSPELYAQFEAIARRRGLSKAALLKLVVQCVVAIETELEPPWSECQ